MDLFNINGKLGYRQDQYSARREAIMADWQRTLDILEEKIEAQNRRIDRVVRFIIETFKGY